MPQIYESALLDSHAQQMTQRMVFVGGALTFPGLFLALSGLVRYEMAYYSAIASGVLAAVLLLVIWWMWAGQPAQLEVHADQLVIRRKWWRAIRVPFSQITAITRLPLTVEMRHVRWATNVGVFGYQGVFISKLYGRYQCLASDRDCLVAISRTNGLLLVVSPFQPAVFVAAAREAISAKVP
jgi:uncharacterized membrane protein